MPIRIGIIEEALLSPLSHNYEMIKQKYGIELFNGTGEYISELFKKNKLDLILIDPINFGKLTGKVESQIVQTHCLALEAYSGATHLEFNPESKSVDAIYYAKEDDYFGMIARILLAERYNSFPEEESDVAKADVKVKRGKEKEGSVGMDLSEIWFDTYEFPLVVGLWICRKDLDKCDPQELTKELFDSTLQDEEPVISHVKTEDYEYDVEGNMHYKWTDDIAESLEQMMELFFMSHIIDKVPQINENGTREEGNIVCSIDGSCSTDSEVEDADDSYLEGYN